jgi:hypothetical protein
MTIINEMIRTPEQPVTDSLAFRSQIESYFNEYFDPAISAKLFMEIFWWSRMEAHRQNVVVDWENPEFIRIFLDKFREIYLSCNTHTIQPLIYNDVTAREVVYNGL